MSIEQQEKQETIEDKKKKLESGVISPDNERSFKDLASELGKPKDGGDKYTCDDLKDAASKRINSMIESSGKKLSPEENKKLEGIKTELLNNMSTDSKEFMKEYEGLRDSITGIIAAGDGKGKLVNDNFQKSQEQQKSQETATTDAFDKLQKFIQEIQEAVTKQKEKLQKQQQVAQNAGNESTGNYSQLFGNKIGGEAEAQLALA